MLLFRLLKQQVVGLPGFAYKKININNCVAFEIKHFCSVSSLQVACVSLLVMSIIMISGQSAWLIVIPSPPPLVGAVINIYGAVINIYK